MANHHFAKLADVWKHLPLAEVLATDRPSHYWESHAGSAVYPMVDDAERRYGALGVWDAATVGGAPGLARSRYLAALRAVNGPGERLTRYPGSARLAMSVLGDKADYLLYDTDPASAASLRAAAAEAGLGGRVEVVEGDGRDGLAAALAGAADPASVLAFVDPFDPRAAGPGGPSALDLGRRLLADGAALVYWYGYHRPDRRCWALDDLAGGGHGVPLWCGDIRVAAQAEPAVRDDGDLAVATTPGTGFGIVCGRVSDPALRHVTALAEALVAAYDGARLPGGEPGRLELTVRTVP
jgi:Ribosomal RNA large subunit methyltransferase D, RlmJ